MDWRFAEITHECVKFAQCVKFSRVMMQMAWVEMSKADDLRTNCKIEDDLTSLSQRHKG